MDKLYDKYYGKIKHEVVKVKREAKRISEMESQLEMNMREATSDRNWGCANTVLRDIALSSQSYADRQKIMAKIWEKLESKAERWRRILKTLSLLEFLVKNGAEQVVGELQSEQTKVRALVDFSCVEDGLDMGNAVREKAKFILEMVGDKQLLRDEREKAKMQQTKFAATCSESHGGGTSSADGSSTNGIAAMAGSALNGAFGDTRIAKDSFEARFAELKSKKTEDCKPSWEKPGSKYQESGGAGTRRDDEKERERPQASRNDRQDDRRRRDDDSPRGGRDRSSSPSGSADRKREPQEAGRGGDYGLFDADDRAGLKSDSDSDADHAEAAPKTLAAPPGAKKTKAPDLLDMFGDEPAAASAAPAAAVDMFASAPIAAPAAAAASGDWAAFGDAAPTAFAPAPAAAFPASGDWNAFGSPPAPVDDFFSNQSAVSNNVDPFGGGMPVLQQPIAAQPFAAPFAAPFAFDQQTLVSQPMAAAPTISPSSFAAAPFVQQQTFGAPQQAAPFAMGGGGYPAPVMAAPAMEWGAPPAAVAADSGAVASRGAPATGPAKLAGNNVEDFITNSLGEFSLNAGPAPTGPQNVPPPVAVQPAKDQGPIDIGDPFTFALGKAPEEF